MRFVLLDRITALEPNQRIRAVKSLSLAEEYLADHFPAFPVMPGVLMVEAMVQASAWLVRQSQDYSHSIVVLSGVRSATYKSFVAPGRVLELDVAARRIEATSSEFDGVGRCGDEEMVKARWSLRHENLSDQDAKLADVDKRIIAELRRQYGLLDATA
jgi:3-hydroxyacyl-[acyl-carrier-protein] dehydratase